MLYLPLLWDKALVPRWKLILWCHYHPVSIDILSDFRILDLLRFPLVSMNGWTHCVSVGQLLAGIFV